MIEFFVSDDSKNAAIALVKASIFEEAVPAGRQVWDKKIIKDILKYFGQPTYILIKK